MLDGKNWLLATDEPIECDYRRITKRFRGTQRIYLKLTNAKSKYVNM